MNIFILNYGGNHGFDVIDFPSGCETHVRLTTEINSDDYILIYCRINEHKHLMQLLLLTNAIKRHGGKNIDLNLSYLPYARQDRVATKGDSFSLEVIANVINSQNYNNVRVIDPHSSISMQIINNCLEEWNAKYYFYEKVLPINIRHNIILISPDAGAMGKTIKSTYHLNIPKQISFCEKQRDPITGQLSNPVCDKNDYEGKDLYILDDICDGGGTFIMLAKELRKRNCGKINLVVTHGIFSKGTNLEGIDHIYCTDSFKDLSNTENFTQYPIWKIDI